MQHIYLDNNATTKIDGKILEYHNTIMEGNFGNASSQYSLGKKSKKIIEDSRKAVKNAINAHKNDMIIFTGCASESNNTVFFSAINSFPKKKHIIISAVEHMSVFSTAMFWKEKGYEVTVIGVDSNGKLNLNEYEKSIRKDTLLISIMAANNETGVVFPIKQLVQIAKRVSPEILFHTDAVQAIGKIPIDVTEMGVDYMSISGHKFYAPKGIGALYIRSTSSFIPFIHGGHQENNMRGGTENVAAIGAVGMAISNIDTCVVENGKRKKMRDWMENEISKICDTMIIGQKSERLPNTSNVAIKNIDGIEIMLRLGQKGIYVSTGSACNSICMAPSHVLTAMAIPEEYQHSIRISLATYTTGKEIKKFVDEFTRIVNDMRRK